MKKLKINLFALSLVSILALVSCDKEDQSYTNTTNSPVGTLVADKTTISESDDDATLALENVATYTFTMDKSYKTNMKFKVELMGSESTATASDFESNLPESGIDNGSEGFLITIPANESAVSFTISGIFDSAAESSEVLKFKITPAGNLNGLVDGNSQMFTLNITNSTSNNLDISFDWGVGKTYIGLDEEEHEYKDFDFDLEIYNVGGNVVESSYSSAPEEIEFSGADGIYTITASFWDASTSPEPMLPINFEPTLTVTKKGVFVRTFDLSGVWNTAIGGDQQGNANAYLDVAYFVKTGSTFQLYDMDDTLLVTGKSGVVKNAIKNISKARKGGRK